MGDLLGFFKAFADADEKLSVRLASSTLGEKTEVIPTGSPSLDDALSCGGLPAGRLIQYYGPPASGKTACALIAITQAQAKDPEAVQVFIDAEGTFDRDWAVKLGVDLSKVYIIDGDLAVNGKRCFEMLLGIPKEDNKHNLIGKKQDGLLDKITKKENNINLIVLDSLGSIIPPGEDVAQVGSSQIARLARFMTDVAKKLSLEVNKAKIPFIIINHKRNSLDIYGPDHTFSGGNAYRHSLSANIYFEPNGGKEGLILNDDEEKIGQRIRATVEKSKFGPHPRKAYFKLLFDKGIIDIHEELFELAIKYGVIERPNNVTYVYNGESYRGRDNALNALNNEQSIVELKNAIEQVRNQSLDEERKKQEEIELKINGVLEQDNDDNLEQKQKKKKSSK